MPYAKNSRRFIASSFLVGIKPPLAASGPPLTQKTVGLKQLEHWLQIESG
jgi:hypothetical protein